MKGIPGLVLLVMCVAPSLGAQGATPRNQALRGRIEAAMMQQITQQLALTAEQQPRVERVLTEWGERRRLLEAEERQLRLSLGRQLRPGVAANVDSTAAMVDRILQNRVDYAESFQGEMRELAPILSPVQRGQFLMVRDQVLRRIRELQEGRAATGGTLRPGPAAGWNRP